eukprot:TRINITY_DN6808_c0_g1_i8.p1 TRINITY_DN6808_c0_g1~~TRINITY_DN6808_c0_g1_i8.p1  ORF type:complete len:607 (-),score=81.11 TRINITY_DN6808_c0_g1_i8:200-2020(-)
MTDPRRILVIYGSQTGTAQQVAERIAREGKRLHFQTHVTSFDEYSMQSLPQEELAVYVVSTTGQGEEPDNMKKSWKMLLRRNLPTNSLAAQRFGVLGLGDSSYPKFNLVAKKLSKRLVQLGGIQLQPAGLGDDQHDLGPDFVIDPWLANFWDKALQLYPMPPGVQPISKETLPEPKYKVIWMDEESDNNFSNGQASIDATEMKTPQPATSAQNPFLSGVKSCHRLTPQDHFQDVRLVELDISNSGIVYSPGDIAIVQPENLQQNVDFFFSLFPNLDKNRKFRLECRDTSFPLPHNSVLPSPCTILEAVTSYFDIQSIPKRYFFELLAHFTTDELEKEKFLEFNTAEGQQELYEYCNRPRRNILEVLYDFRHTTPNIPFDYLFDLIPQIKSRSFSIASSQEKHGNNLQLLVAVVRYMSNLKSPRLGLCSNWLARRNQGDKIKVWTRSGTLKFPPNEETPCILVGPGTGVAPFRSFISSVVASSSNKRQIVLFFGSRNKSADFFFADEWSADSADSADNVKVITAFSRDQEDKIYVQHRIQENKELVCDLIFDKKGWFYVAGNSKFMPTQVRDALIECLTSRLCSREEAEKYVSTMEAKGRYQTETWS